MSPTDRPVRRRALPRWSLFLLALAVLSLSLFAHDWIAAPAPATPAAPPADPTPHLATAGGPAAAETPPERRDAAPAEPAAMAPPPDFAAEVEHLAELGLRTAALMAADEMEQARANDDAARAAFGELLARFPNAGERALDRMTSLGTNPDDLDRARRAVLQLVLTAECVRRQDAATAAGDGTRIDGLVTSTLVVMQHGGAVAEIGGAVLDGRPYLHLVHEPRVLDLVQGAAEGLFPRPIATRLLLTLWDNVQRRGERSSAELASLALLQIGDPDPSKRTAACRQLLADPRYRHVVLAWLREHHDPAVAAEVAGLAARELAPNEALAVLRELAPVAPNLPGAYLSLGCRAPAALTEAYRELLASDTEAGVRTDLVAGLATAEPGEALPTVELALASDPSPGVRVQAMLTLTATAAASHGEAAIQRALDDPAVGTDPSRLAVVVLALQNLEAAGLVNALDRLGQRLRSAPLRHDSREALEQLLARALPGGRTSEGAGRGGR